MRYNKFRNRARCIVLSINFLLALIYLSVELRSVCMHANFPLNVMLVMFRLIRFICRLRLCAFLRRQCYTLLIRNFATRNICKSRRFPLQSTTDCSLICNTRIYKLSKLGHKLRSTTIETNNKTVVIYDNFHRVTAISFTPKTPQGFTT